jgi:hypothetical protein
MVPGTNSCCKLRRPKSPTWTCAVVTKPVADAIAALPQTDATQVWREIHEAERNTPAVQTNLQESQALLAEIHRRRSRQEKAVIGVLARLHADYRQRRNRQRSEETIQRDAEIARLRDSEGLIWEHIAVCVGMSERSVRRAYKRYHEKD